MANPKQKKRTGIPPTQRYLNVLEVRDDVVVLQDGTLRGILLVSSINFDLKSEDEQIAVIQSYTQFLNGLDFNLQIVIQSRKFNIDDYLTRLKALEKQQTNDLLKLQTAEYRQYIAELVELADLMSKRFYVSVPYSPTDKQRKNFVSKISSVFAPAGTIRLKQEQFMQYKAELFKRVDFCIEGLANVAGLKAVVLDTQGLIELLYNCYNPQMAKQEPLAAIKELNVL